MGLFIATIVIVGHTAGSTVIAFIKAANVEKNTVRGIFRFSITGLLRNMHRSPENGCIANQCNSNAVSQELF
jgi:hypothetical protein